MGEHFIAGYCKARLTFCAPGKLCARPTCLSAISNPARGHIDPSNQLGEGLSMWSITMYSREPFVPLESQSKFLFERFKGAWPAGNIGIPLQESRRHSLGSGLLVGCVFQKVIEGIRVRNSGLVDNQRAVGFFGNLYHRFGRRTPVLLLGFRIPLQRRRKWAPNKP
jgi:hypothetical protein